MIFYMQTFSAFCLIFLDSIFHSNFLFYSQILQNTLLKAGRKLGFIKVGELSRTVVYVLTWLSVSLKRILERMHCVEEVNHFF